MKASTEVLSGNAKQGCDTKNPLPHCQSTVHPEGSIRVPFTEKAWGNMGTIYRFDKDAYSAKEELTTQHILENDPGRRQQQHGGSGNNLDDLWINTGDADCNMTDSTDVTASTIYLNWRNAGMKLRNGRNTSFVITGASLSFEKAEHLYHKSRRFSSRKVIWA